MDVTLKNLPFHLEQIRAFLINNEKTFVFPSLTMAMEDILVYVAEDPSYLRKFDDEDCKNIARQITEILEENKQIYTLGYSFENLHGKRAMVYKKVPVHIINEPLGLKQLRKPHTAISQPSNDSTKITVMSSFKTKWLNATLKFVKDDKQFVLQYPHVSTEQADFIKRMVEQCLSPSDGSDTPGGRGMFDPLADALKIYSAKYDFVLNNAVPVKIDMKRLFFEKIPKKVKEKNWWADEASMTMEEELNVDSRIHKKWLTKSSMVDCKMSSNMPLAVKVENGEDCPKQDTLKVKAENYENTPDYSITSNAFLTRKLKLENFSYKTETEVNRTVNISNKENATVTMNKENVAIHTLDKENMTGNTLVKENATGNTLDKENATCNTLVKENATGNTLATENATGNILVKENVSGNTLAKENVTGNTLAKEYVTGNTLAKENVTGNTLAKENVTGNTLAKKNVSGNTLAKEDVTGNTLAKENVTGNTLAKENVSGNTLAKEDVTGNTLAKENAIGNTLSKEKVTGNTLAKETTVNSTNKSNVTVNASNNGTINAMTKTANNSFAEERRIVNEWVKGYERNRLYFEASESKRNVISNSNCKTHKKLSVHVQKYIDKTNLLPEEWIISTFNQLKSFIEDDAQCSLVIKNINKIEMEILTKWQKVFSRLEVISQYKYHIQLLLMGVRNSMNEKMSKFRITTSGTKVRKDMTRDLTFTKTPYYGNSSTQMPVETAPKFNLNKVENAAKYNAKEMDTNVIEPVRQISQGMQKLASVTSLPTKKAILTDRGRPKSATVKSLQEKVKLIEALSQPLVSERGLKMMRNMGWDGGALGLRGEGIVEPIALPLDLKKGAGLGCEKLAIRLPHSSLANLPVNITRVALPYTPGKSEYRTGVLQTVLKMVEQALPAVELAFPSALTPKQWAFVEDNVNVINKRVKMRKELSPLAQLGGKIVDVLAKTEYSVAACWGVSKMNILLILLKDVDEPLDLDRKDWCAVVNVDRGKSAFSDNVIKCGETFRYYVMAHLLEFCGQNIIIDKVPNDAVSKEIHLKQTMTKKHMSFIDDLIVRLNNKSRPSTDSEKERVLFNEIKELIQDFHLEVHFPVTNAEKKEEFNVIRFTKINLNPKSKTTEMENWIEEKDKLMRGLYNVDVTENKQYGVEEAEIEYLFKTKLKSLQKEDDKSMTMEKLHENIQNLSIKADSQETELNGFSDVRFLDELIKNSNIESDKDIFKRPISTSSTPDRPLKRSKLITFSKKINITHKNECEITNENAGKIQKSILDSIDYTDDLPLLECHGIQNGGLSYTCHNEKSFNFITNLMKSLNYDVNVTESEDKHKMTMKIRSYVKESVDTIFDRLEAYNMSIRTKYWKVFDVERSCDCIVISMEVDEESFNFICKRNFILFAGIDRAKISLFD